MTTVMTAGYISEATVPIWHTRLLYDQIARLDAASINVSGTASGAFPEAPVTDQTWEWWEPDVLPGWWEVDAGSNISCNAIGIAAHDLGTQGAQVIIQYSTNGVDYTQITTHSPSDDAPILFLFAAVSARYWRVRIASGATAPPKMCVIYIGTDLAMQRPVKWNGHTPGVLNPRITKRPSMSERGQRLGTTLIREGFEASFTVENLRELWVRDRFLDFMRSAWRYGYFVSWRPADFPDEVLFGWTEDAIAPANAGSGDLPRDGATLDDGRRMNVDWSLRAHGGYVSGIVPWGAT